MKKFLVVETAEYVVEAEDLESAKDAYDNYGPETPFPCTITDQVFIEIPEDS